MEETQIPKDVLVIGAGIGGLCAALALGRTGRKITLLERDAPPPASDPEAVFLDWNRRGVGHLRQSHAFLARLREIIRQDHPQLREELLTVGVRELTFEGMLSPMQKAKYKPQAEDDNFTLLTSRRTTLELVIRRYVERLENVNILSEHFVTKLLIDDDASAPLTVVGVEVDTASGKIELKAGVIIDASGKSGSGLEQLISQGAEIDEESESAGILYFTRHYRFRPGFIEPPREGNPPTNGDLGYLKFGVFPADNHCFSITICVPEIEYELRKSIVDPATWDRMIDHLPGLRVWADPERAEAASKVFGMGDLHSRWRNLVAGGKPSVIGYFPIGDTVIRTNPLYGRGCSFAAVAAYAVRDVLAQTSDPGAQMIAYQARLIAELRPYYVTMRTQDRGAIRRAEQALTPNYKPTLRGKILRSFIEDAIGPAVRYDVNLLREAMRAFHMFENPDLWLKRPRNFLRVLYFWARGKRRNAPAYPQKAGPGREDMLRALGLSHDADMIILANHRREAADKPIAA